MVGLLSLEDLGWSSFFADQLEKVDRPSGQQVVRVVAIHKGACDVSNGVEIRPAKMTGRLRHQARSRSDYPTVGDWVLVKDFDKGEFGRVDRVLERRSVLRRKSAGRSSREQLIASNLDRAFIVQGMGSGFSLKRIERYLVMVNESGIEPVIVLTKRDLLTSDACEEVEQEVRQHLPSVQVHLISNETGEGLPVVKALFEPGITCCVVGISGAGKSTLLNRVLGEERLFTLPVRESDGKGVHTTTWRELITLENGGHVIDTPGMRELGNMEAESGIGETFDDIQVLAADCRFGDCAHVYTEGCAVMAAVEAGTLPQERYDHYVRLMSEAARFSEGVVEKREQDRRLARFRRTLQEGRSKPEESE
jgi:ribosome biogenesis GTPase